MSKPPLIEQTAQAGALLRAERLTLAVLLCGVASLALSDFVSPIYWSISVMAALLRLWRGPAFHLTEMQASFIGWAGFFWVALELMLGRELVVAFTDFLLILALAVVVEAATPRNHLHRMLVGLFLLLGAAVLTDSMLFVLPLTAMLWFLWRASACLYGLNWPGGDLPATSMGQDLRWMPLIAAVAALLFVGLPRFEFHSLLTAQQPRMQTSGFSDRVQLGDFARQLDERVVMRVEPAPAGDMHDEATHSNDVRHFRAQLEGRYWRGVALSRFTGRGWKRLASRHRQRMPEGVAVSFSDAEGIDIAVYREASDHAYVPLPYGIVHISGLPQAAFFDDSGALSFAVAPSHRLRLLMRLGDMPTLSNMRSPVRQEREISAVPAALTAWVREKAAGISEKQQALRHVLNTLKGWRYDLHIAVDAMHPIASFLQNRRGHCELFATTLALAARQLGFAARVVNGYYGGEWNEIGSFLLIRQKYAHSWVEVWQNGHWQRMDPTPPSRWQSGYDSAWMPDELWESAKLVWYRYVLTFEDSDRNQLISRLWHRIKADAGWLMLMAALLAGLVLVFKLSLKYRSKWIRLGWWNRHAAVWPVLDGWLHGRGIHRRAHQPLSAIAAPEGVGKQRWRAFVDGWEAQAYGRERTWCRRDVKRHLRALLQGD